MHRSSAAISAVTTILLLALASPAQASTDAAWAASTKAGRAACIAAANLARPIVSAPLNFSDQVGRDAMLVRGRYKQRYMKNALGTMLCLYDRRTHKAETVDAKGWTAG
ncbi:hypothetical protein ACSBM8_12745 [Sphingomonas sp. ASY06-1R]|uniref:hypothetical protein n=1 Tax=Sphingomonas sp. ASY06-1R TaxID=3445771 RepID=UPI003FA205A1